MAYLLELIIPGSYQEEKANDNGGDFHERQRGEGGGAKEVEVGIEDRKGEGGKERKRMEGDESGGRRG